MSGAFSLALAASIFLLVFPTGTIYQGGQYHGTTLLQSAGPGVLILLSFPVVITLLPLLFRKEPVRILAAILMCALVFIGGASIGLFYAPSAVAAIVGAGVGFSVRS